jgi:hypothetical protein
MCGCTKRTRKSAEQYSHREESSLKIYYAPLRGSRLRGCYGIDEALWREAADSASMHHYR